MKFQAHENLTKAIGRHSAEGKFLVEPTLEGREPAVIEIDDNDVDLVHEADVLNKTKNLITVIEAAKAPSKAKSAKKADANAADELVEEAKTKAETMISEAKIEGAAIVNNAKDAATTEAKTITDVATADAEKTTAEAKELADSTLTEAQTKATELTEQASAKLEEANTEAAKIVEDAKSKTAE